MVKSSKLERSHSKLVMAYYKVVGLLAKKGTDLEFIEQTCYQELSSCCEGMFF